MKHLPHLSRALASVGGLDSVSVDRLIARQAALRSSGAPQIYSLKHLAISANVEWAFLRSVIRRDARGAYRYLRIPKKTGGYRDLQAPTENLLQTQRWVLHQVLEVLPRHPDNFAYFKGITTRECVERHTGARWMIKADIHNYFPSVHEGRVFSVFESLGYSRLLAFEMARICTWPSSRPAVGGSAGPKPERPYSSELSGVLPQGAPTSGALANAVTYQLDVALSDFALRNRLVYTRYSDDMAFSSAGDFSRERASDLIGQIRRIVTSSGLSLHSKKTKLIPPGARLMLLGMMISKDDVQILPEHRRRIELYIHAVDKYGLVEFSAVRKFDSAVSFVNHVFGWLAYLSNIDGEWALARTGEWEAALRKHNIQTHLLG